MFKRHYGEEVSIKEFFAEHPVYPHQGWDRFPEEIRLPTAFHFENQTACGNLPVTVAVGIVESYGLIAPKRRNPG